MYCHCLRNGKEKALSNISKDEELVSDKVLA